MRMQKEDTGKRGLSRRKFFKAGMLSGLVAVFSESSSVFRIAPPLTSSYEHLDRAVEIFAEAIREEVS